MRRHQVMKKGISILSAAVLASFATSASGWVNPLTHRYVDGELNICDQGSFFVGGVPKVTNYASSSTAGPPQQIIIGQMYVQFEIPKKRRQWPLIVMHGSSHTGACLEATPDGREGWLPYAVRRYNLAMFVVDQPGRGRSGFDQSLIQEALGTNNLSLIPTSWGRITDNGAWTSWFGHIINGTNIVNGTMIRHGDPGDPDPPEDFSIRKARQVPAGVPYPSNPEFHESGSGRARGSDRTRAEPGQRHLPGPGLLQAAGPQRRGDTAHLNVCHLRADDGRVGQYVGSACLG